MLTLVAALVGQASRPQTHQSNCFVVAALAILMESAKPVARLSGQVAEAHRWAN